MTPSGLAITLLASLALAHPAPPVPTKKLDVGGLRIIGGESASPDEFPFAASLAIRFSGGIGLCGGSIISSNVIVTAAHCVFDPITGEQVAAKNIYIGAGSNQRSQQNLTQAVRIVPDPLYSTVTGNNDIALVFASHLPVDNRTVSAVPVYPGSLPANTTLTVIGWGQTLTNPAVDSTSDALMKTQVKIGGKEDCQKYLEGYVSSDGPQICTENILNPGKDTCQGDSGGGALVSHKGKYYLAGLTSYGSNIDGDPTCALNDGFGVYTHVNYYIDFISNATGIPKSSFYEKSHSAHPTN
ncbi:hypothetical protein GGI12_002098 [Dipsacomyces acuminosporus]|nr:hypothetical protein GGI12_002098 [Dipsacomyces acuminosporus]